MKRSEINLTMEAMPIIAYSLTGGKLEDISMALVKRIQLENNYVKVPNETAKHCETEISLQATGLLVNIMAYSENWELHKTELYKRYANNKETSVNNAWKELVEAGYIIEYKYRVGKKWEYVYYVRLLPFNEVEKAEILDHAVKEHSEIWGLDFQDLKMKTSKSRGNQKELTKQKLTKEKQNNISKDSATIYGNTDDDKKRISQSESNGSYMSSVDENINIMISALRESTREELTDRSFNAVVRKVLDKYNQGKVKNLRDYLVTSLINKIEALELRRTKEDSRMEMLNTKHMSQSERSEAYIQSIEYAERRNVYKNLPFYNWLED